MAIIAPNATNYTMRSARHVSSSPLLEVLDISRLPFVLTLFSSYDIFTLSSIEVKIVEFINARQSPFRSLLALPLLDF